MSNQHVSKVEQERRNGWWVSHHEWWAGVMVLWCCPSVMVVCQSGGCVNRAKTMSQATQATLDALLERWGCFGVPQGTWECQNPQCQHSWCGEMEENFPSLFETEVNSLHKEGCGYSTTTMPKFNSSNHLNLYSSYHIEVQPDYIQQFFSSFFSLDLASPVCWNSTIYRIQQNSSIHSTVVYSKAYSIVIWWLSTLL